MITLKKRNYSIYLIIGMVILTGIGSVIFYNNENDSPWLILIGILNTILFTLGIEKISFKGRYSNKIFLHWLIYLIASILSLALILMILSIAYYIIFGTNASKALLASISTPIGFTIIIYFTFKFFQILYKRLQDLNQPGYYLIGLIPIISWVIGVKIYKSGYKFLGVLVFLNLAIGIIYILIAKGSKGSNYFGIKPNHIYVFNKEIKRIKNAKSLGNSEKEKLKKDLIEKYVAIETNELEEFKKSEIDRLIKKEKLKVDKESAITQKQNDFYENSVLEQIEKNYLRFNWC